MGMVFNWPVESTDWLEPVKHFIYDKNKLGSQMKLKNNNSYKYIIIIIEIL